jgi:hypothetical protein
MSLAVELYLACSPPAFNGAGLSDPDVKESRGRALLAAERRSCFLGGRSGQSG